jgi:hypothetical protein
MIAVARDLTRVGTLTTQQHRSGASGGVGSLTRPGRPSDPGGGQLDAVEEGSGVFGGMGRVGALAFGDDLPADVEVVDGSKHPEG